MRHTTRALFAALTLLADAASADVPPPGLDECRGHDAGSTCTLMGAAGTCRATTCSRINYAGWDRDASAAPPSITYACTLCIAGPASDGSSAPATPASSGGCSVGDASRAVGPWAIAAVPLALALIARRRRRAPLIVQSV